MTGNDILDLVKDGLETEDRVSVNESLADMTPKSVGGDDGHISKENFTEGCLISARRHDQKFKKSTSEFPCLNVLVVTGGPHSSHIQVSKHNQNSICD